MSLHDQILDFTLPENVEESEVDTTAVASEATLPPLPKPSKRKPRSNMWDHFDKQPGDEMYAKCHYCGDLIKYKSGTSSMRNHLARCKESPINTSNKRQRQAMSNATEGQVASSPSYSKFDQAACRLQLAKTIVSAELPLLGFDILGWWKVNSVRFPILATIAREVLAIPVSTVASECAFSTGGRVLGDHRCCLKHTMLEGLVCLQDWLKGQPHYLFNDEDPEEILRFDQEISSQDCGVNLDD